MKIDENSKIETNPYLIDPKNLTSKEKICEINKKIKDLERVALDINKIEKENHSKESKQREAWFAALKITSDQALIEEILVDCISNKFGSKHKAKYYFEVVEQIIKNPLVSDYWLEKLIDAATDILNVNTKNLVNSLWYNKTFSCEQALKLSERLTYHECSVLKFKSVEDRNKFSEEYHKRLSNKFISQKIESH